MSIPLNGFKRTVLDAELATLKAQAAQKRNAQIRRQPAGPEASPGTGAGVGGVLTRRAVLDSEAEKDDLTRSGLLEGFDPSSQLDTLESWSQLASTLPHPAPTSGTPASAQAAATPAVATKPPAEAGLSPSVASLFQSPSSKPGPQLSKSVESLFNSPAKTPVSHGVQLAKCGQQAPAMSSSVASLFERPSKPTGKASVARDTAADSAALEQSLSTPVRQSTEAVSVPAAVEVSALEDSLVTTAAAGGGHEPAGRQGKQPQGAKPKGGACTSARAVLGSRLAEWWPGPPPWTDELHLWVTNDGLTEEEEEKKLRAIELYDQMLESVKALPDAPPKRARFRSKALDFLRSFPKTRSQQTQKPWIVLPIHDKWPERDRLSQMMYSHKEGSNGSYNLPKLSSEEFDTVLWAVHRGFIEDHLTEAEAYENGLVQILDPATFAFRPADTKCPGHRLSGLVWYVIDGRQSLMSAKDAVTFYCDDRRLMELVGPFAGHLCEDGRLDISSMKGSKLTITAKKAPEPAGAGHLGSSAAPATTAALQAAPASGSTAAPDTAVLNTSLSQGVGSSHAPVAAGSSHQADGHTMPSGKLQVIGQSLDRLLQVDVALRAINAIMLNVGDIPIPPGAATPAIGYWTRASVLQAWTEHLGQLGEASQQHHLMTAGMGRGIPRAGGAGDGSVAFLQLQEQVRPMGLEGEARPAVAQSNGVHRSTGQAELGGGRYPPSMPPSRIPGPPSTTVNPFGQPFAPQQHSHGLGPGVGHVGHGPPMSFMPPMGHGPGFMPAYGGTMAQPGRSGGMQGYHVPHGGGPYGTGLGPAGLGQGLPGMGFGFVQGYPRGPQQGPGWQYGR